MYPIEEGSTMFYCDVENPELYCGVTFYVKNKKVANNTIEYNSRLNNGISFDAVNRNKFIYGTGDGVAIRSYITFAEWRDMRTHEKDNLYFIGSNVGTALVPVGIRVRSFRLKKARACSSSQLM